MHIHLITTMCKLWYELVMEIMCVTSILTLLQLIDIVHTIPLIMEKLCKVCVLLLYWIYYNLLILYILCHLLWRNCNLLTTLSELRYTSNDWYIMDITYTSILLHTYACCKYDQSALYEYMSCISSMITMISLYTLPHKHVGCYIIENT